MFGKKQGEIAKLESELATATAVATATNDRLSELAEEHEQLRRRMPALRGAELAGAQADTERLRGEYKRLETRHVAEVGTVHRLQVALNRKRQALAVARQNLETVNNPPPWGFGEHVTQSKLRDVKRQAQATIARLVGE
jgi:chromosome segregation ATPase